MKGLVGNLSKDSPPVCIKVLGLTFHVSAGPWGTCTVHYRCTDVINACSIGGVLLLRCSWGAAGVIMLTDGDPAAVENQTWAENLPLLMASCQKREVLVATRTEFSPSNLTLLLYCLKGETCCGCLMTAEVDMFGIVLMRGLVRQTHKRVIPATIALLCFKHSLSFLAPIYHSWLERENVTEKQSKVAQTGGEWVAMGLVNKV